MFSLLGRRSGCGGTNLRGMFDELGLLARGIAPVYDPFRDCLIKVSHCLRQQLINLGQIFLLNSLSGALQESPQPRPDGDVSLSAFFRLSYSFNRRTVGWHVFDPFPRCREALRDNPTHELQYVISVGKPGGILPDYHAFVNRAGRVGLVRKVRRGWARTSR